MSRLAEWSRGKVRCRDGLHQKGDRFSVALIHVPPQFSVQSISINGDVAAVHE